MKSYRQGAKGALLDEYERAMAELQQVITRIPDDTLPEIIDPDTEDDNCRSFQTILSHVVNSGYSYAIYIQQLKGITLQRPAKVFHTTIQDYQKDLNEVFGYTEKVFENIQDNELEQYDQSKKVKTSWQQYYDMEQMMEHAIVHILRHRRQIEKFMQLRGLTG